MPDLFDPSRARGAAPLEPDDRPLSVSQLSELIKDTLETRLGSTIRVVGEISNLSRRNHWYFSMKDENAVISCVMWASSARRVKFTPDDGDEVLAVGHVSHYAPQGRTQLYVGSLQRVGAGELERRFQELCTELRRAGYFAEERKRPLPALPRRIAVITSAGGAAVQDVVATAAQRLPAVGLLIVDVPVQGAAAAPAIAAAIRDVDRRRETLGIDAILVTRGGGSIEDLWAFNEPAVADAVFRCRLPVVAAIGHESDTTVIELVADRRAATPTQAAMQLVPERGALQRQLDHVGDRLSFVIGRLLEDRRQRLRAVVRHEAFRTPEHLIERAADRLRHLAGRLVHAIAGSVSGERTRLERLRARWLAAGTERLVQGHRIHMRQLERRLALALARTTQQRRSRLDELERRLASVDPRQVLQRGFTYTTGRGGQLVRSVRDVRSGDALRTHLADGDVRSTVDGGSARTRRSRDAPPQMDLFDRSK